MSEQGWRAFLSAEGVEDWVVLHGGACAVFEAGSLRGAVELAGRITEVLGDDVAGVTFTITNSRLSVRLTRGLADLEEPHIALAQEISRIAHEMGAPADRASVQEVQMAVSARPDDIDVGFWRAVLGYRESADDDAVDPLGHSSTVWMHPLDAERPLRHAMHLDVSLAREEADRRVAAAVAAGGRVVRNDEAHATRTLSDRAGNRVCVVAWPDGAGTA